MSRTQAPEDHESADPDAPAKLRALDGKTWKYTARRTLAEFGKDGGTDLAAMLTYYTVLSIAPALLAVFSIFSLVLRSYRDQISIALESVLARADVQEAYKTLARDTVEQILASAGGGGASIALAVSILLGIWLASGYVKAFSRMMNTIYGVREGRTIVKQTGAMLLATIVILLCAVVILAAAVVSPGVLRPVLGLVAEPLGLGGPAEFLLNTFLPIWAWVKWPVIVTLMILALDVLFHLAPNVARRRFRVLSVGAVVAIVGMLIAAGAISLYITRFASFSSYGAIGTVVAVLIALWVMNMGMVLGAEVDAEVERAHELAAGVAAEEVLRLPLRDDTSAVKADRKLAKLIDDGRALRLAPLHEDDVKVG